MKKIGILTLPLGDNYGGMLQAVTLYEFLSEQGYDVKFIYNTGYKSLLKRLIIKLFENIPFLDIRGFLYSHKKIMFHRDFLNKYLVKQTRSVSTYAEFKSITNKEKFDYIIVGSDQVWRWDYIKLNYKIYFLDFVDNIYSKKIAYAASFGSDNWGAPSKVNDIKKMLSSFSAVSTREKNGLAICSELGRLDCEFVIDPTLLINPIFYDRFIVKTDSNQSSSPKMLLVYILDNTINKSNYVNEILQRLGKNYFIKEINLQSALTVPEWVNAFNSAEFIITDSYHGMIFSIIFNKEFYIFSNFSRGASRFTSLLETLDLQNRIIHDDKSFKFQLTLDKKIEYTPVNEKVNHLRTKSSIFLKEAINSNY